MSADPPLATGEYLPTGEKKHDANLPGMDGVFNAINLNGYHYSFNNPIVFSDPDGREGITVSGQPGFHDNKRHFLENGLDRAKKVKDFYKKTGSSEDSTWIIYNEGGKYGYSDELLNEYVTKARDAGINVYITNNTKAITNYVNNKTKNDPRSQDKITLFLYVGHATPGNLDIGYTKKSGATLEIDKFKRSAFSRNSSADLVGGCRTAVRPFWGKSAAEKMSRVIGKKILGSDVRVNYTGGVLSNKELLKSNNGKVVNIDGWAD